jgi:hypothetical protein
VTGKSPAQRPNHGYGETLNQRMAYYRMWALELLYKEVGRRDRVHLFEWHNNMFGHILDKRRERTDAHREYNVGRGIGYAGKDPKRHDIAT